jgi:hypothetical protein
MIKQVRTTVYVPEEQYRQLRSKLVLKGLTISGWIRKQISRELKK